MMKILFVVPYVPNLIRVRPYNLIRALSERGHEVTVLTLWVNEQEQKQLEELQEIAHSVQALPMPAWRSLLNCVPALFSADPLQTVFSWQPELVKHLNGRSPYDVIHVEHLRGARYGLHLKTNTHAPVIWDSVDCISHLFSQAATQSKSAVSRLRSLFELKRTKRYEGWLLDKFDHVLVTSSLDQRALLELNGDRPHAPISVLHNGVDLDYFSPAPFAEREKDTIVVSGKMSYHANVTMVMHLAKEIMPHVWAQKPEVKLWVVGKDPVREIEALSQHPNVTVTGTVPDLRDYLGRAAVAVTPITYGAGIQNKVLEAMACATPVVTTPKAVAAIDVEHNRELLIASTPKMFAQELVNLLADPDKQQRLAQAGRDYVEKYHSWSNIAARLENIYHTAIVAAHGAPIAV